MVILSFLKTFHLSWLFVIAGLLILFVGQIIHNSQTFLEWDWLLLSGIVTFTVATYFAQKVPSKWKITIRRLLDRGVLIANSTQLEDVNIRLNRVAKDLAFKGAILTSLIILGSFLSLYGLDNRWLTLLETIGGFLAGWLLGRLAAYGRLPAILKQENLSLKAEPEHIDQVCGWQPLGDFYLFQAVVAAIPAIFLTVWLVIFPIVKRYEYWGMTTTRVKTGHRAESIT